MAGKDIIYWDTCLFIAHLKNEDRQDPLDIQGILDLSRLIDENQIGLATSTITLVEILQSTIEREQYKNFTSLFGRSNIHLVDVTKEIAEIASKIRDYYKVDNQPTVSTPDAIHLATAISFNCSVFYTFDENNRNGRPLALIPLSQPIAGIYRMPIQKPIPGQLSINFPVNN